MLRKNFVSKPIQNEQHGFLQCYFNRKINQEYWELVQDLQITFDLDP